MRARMALDAWVCGDVNILYMIIERELILSK